MTSDPQAWFLSSQALDHHDTAAALDRSVQGELGEALASDLASGLARAGYALVRVEHEPVQAMDFDLSKSVTDFLSRVKD